jgi:hypothetical protein
VNRAMKRPADPQPTRRRDKLRGGKPGTVTKSRSHNHLLLVPLPASSPDCNRFGDLNLGPSAQFSACPRDLPDSAPLDPPATAATNALPRRALVAAAIECNRDDSKRQPPDHHKGGYPSKIRDPDSANLHVTPTASDACRATRSKWLLSGGWTAKAAGGKHLTENNLRRAFRHCEKKHEFRLPVG